MNQCMNIKSKHYRSIQCLNKTISGEYCKKHIKNPTRFSSNLHTKAATIQRCWKKYSHSKKFSRQGPAIHYKSLASNSSEACSLENLENIPNLYFYSFSDCNKNIWAFDIRTLSYLFSKSNCIQNPYTRDYLNKENLEKIKKRISWLKERKYKVMYENDVVLTNEQIWNQNVLDVFTKIDEAGYLVNSEWFHEMKLEDHKIFYKKLYDIWNYRIGLSMKEKNHIVPGFNSRNKLFKLSPTELIDKDEKCLRKINLLLIQKLVTSVPDKAQTSLGIMYVLMALSYVSNSVVETFPWIIESLN